MIFSEMKISLHYRFKEERKQNEKHNQIQAWKTNTKEIFLKRFKNCISDEMKKRNFQARNRRCEKQRNKKSERVYNLRILQTIQSIKIFPTYKSIPLKGIWNWVEIRNVDKR